MVLSERDLSVVSVPWIRGPASSGKTGSLLMEGVPSIHFWAISVTSIAIIRIGGIQLGEELFQLPKLQKRRKP